MVPEGWSKYKIKDIASIQVGRDLQVDRYSDVRTETHIYPVYSNTVENKGLYGFYDFPEYSGKSVTIVGRGIGLGTAFARFENEKFGAIGRLLVISPKSDLFDVGYLADYINFSLRIYNEDGGIPQLPGAALANYHLTLPPISEQKKIAQILSTWDKAIATAEKLLENSQKQKQALMQQLLTGKKRLHGFSDNWKHPKLKVLIEEGKLRNQNLAVDRVLSVTNHSGFVLPEDQFSKRVASDDVSNYKIVKRGQYGYNPSRLNVGSFARLDDYEIGILSPMYVVFSIDEDKLNSDFFYNWMQSNEAKQRIKNSTQGSVRDSVGFDALSSFLIKLPSLAEQEKIAFVLNAADKEIQTIQTKLEFLKKEKKALMQQLLTGKRRVKVEH